MLDNNNYDMVTTAKMTILDWSGNRTMHPTSDYFLYNGSPYTYSGVALVWEFENDKTCSMQTVNTTSIQLRKLVKLVQAYPNFAISIKYNAFKEAGCTTDLQVNTAMNKLATQLQQAGFPKIQLLILLNNDGRYIIWNDESIAYHVNSIFNGVLYSSPIKIVAVNIYENTLPYLANTDRYKLFRYDVEHERGAWNRVFLSIGYTCYKWIYFGLLLLALLYACARVARLHELRMLERDLLLVAFIITIIYCVAFLTRLPFMSDLFTYQTDVCNLLSKIPLDLILWHWSNVGKKLFSRKAIMCLQGTIVVDSIMSIALFLYRIPLYHVELSLSDETAANSLLTLVRITKAILVMDGIIFGAFAIWFGMTAREMKRHAEGRGCFIKFAIFTSLACLTYILLVIWITILASSDQTLLTPVSVVTADIAFNTIYVIRALLFLFVLGIRWPKTKNAEMYLSISEIEERRTKRRGIL
ncbi:hypothetical protein BDF22DRAFT_745240 [Syncephalis plumigaleata]|nr:hypothetical protein BDF22DRAFT_745240 [Syncephalis plumigaleata]